MKKKVLLILHLPQPIHGASIVGRCIKESTFINNTIDADFVNLSTSKSIKSIGSINFYKVIHILKLQAKVLTHLFKKKYNLCYMTLTSSGSGFYKDLFIVLLLKLFNKKIVYHFHNKGIEPNQHKFINNLLYKFAFKNSSVILLSPALYNDIEKYIQPQRVFFCPNGIKNDVVVSSKKKELKKINILFFSNMLVLKGPLILLEACKLLKRNNIDYECHFVGDWSDISESHFRNEISRSGLNNQVFAHGKKEGVEKNYFFEKADIFILPTFKDCFPLVLLEAMSYGLPLISTNEGAIPEILEDGLNGFIIPKNDPDILSNSIQKLFNNPHLMAQIKSENLKKYADKYTLKKFEQNFINVINSIL